MAHLPSFWLLFWRHSCFQRDKYLEIKEFNLVSALGVPVVATSSVFQHRQTVWFPEWRAEIHLLTVLPISENKKYIVAHRSHGDSGCPMYLVACNLRSMKCPSLCRFMRSQRFGFPVCAMPHAETVPGNSAPENVSKRSSLFGFVSGFLCSNPAILSVSENWVAACSEKRGYRSRIRSGCKVYYQ